MARLIMTLLLLAPIPVMAQPADCRGPAGVPGLGGLATIGLNLAGRAAAAVGGRPAAPAAPQAAPQAPPPAPPPGAAPPGAASPGAASSGAPSALGMMAAGASTFLSLPLAVPLAIVGNACRDHPRPPDDVLHGEPGDVLHGPHSADLLRGPGQPHVKVGQ